MENQERKSEVIEYPEIAVEIEKMILVDQEMRQRNLQDSEYWDDEIDKKNTERMKAIITEIGWPTVSKVGKRSSRNAWLLVQHADHDVEFQKRCLKLMKQEPESEVSRQNIAYLEDRILVKESGQQLYGTQFEQRDGKYIPRPIKDVEAVDKRRGEMGLGTLEEGIQQMYEKYDQLSKDE